MSKEKASITSNFIYLVLLAVPTFVILYNEIGIFLTILSEGSIDNISLNNSKYGFKFFGKEAVIQHIVVIPLAIMMMFLMVKPLKMIINDLRNK